MNKINNIRLSFGTIVSTIGLQAMHFWGVMTVEAVLRFQRYLRQFWCIEEAQDLVEYTMILAVFVMACIGVATMLTPSIKTIWSTGNAVLSNGVTVATS
jgi:Flp pilus assembly pilin Flp